MLFGRVLLFFSLASSACGMLSCDSLASQNVTINFASHTILTCVDSTEKVQGCLVQHFYDKSMTALFVRIDYIMRILTQLMEAYGEELGSEILEDFNFSGKEKYTGCKKIQDAILGNVTAFKPIEKQLYDQLEQIKLRDSAKMKEDKVAQPSMAREIDNKLDSYSYWDRFNDDENLITLPVIQKIPMCDIKSKPGGTYFVHTDLSLHLCNNNTGFFDFITCSNTTSLDDILLCPENGAEDYLFTLWTGRDPCYTIVRNITLPIQMDDCFKDPENNDIEFDYFGYY